MGTSDAANASRHGKQNGFSSENWLLFWLQSITSRPSLGLTMLNRIESHFSLRYALGAFLLLIPTLLVMAVASPSRAQNADAAQPVRLEERGLEEIAVASLAKRFEEVYLPGSSVPVNVPRGSEALFMLQRIRDEAHRFANSFHRELRGKRMTASSLDGIPGLGEARRAQLVKIMGGVNAVKRASLDELKAQSFLPDAVAEAIHAKFHPAESPESSESSESSPQS